MRFLGCFLLFFVVGCATTYNPATGRRELIFISTKSEVSMGQDIHKQLLSQYKLSDNLAQTSRLKRVGERLSRVSDRQDYEYHFYLIDKDEMNAFTTPGGNIYVFSGLLDKLKTDDEVAAVVGHEIGHCAARHTVKKFQAALGYNLVGAIALSQVGAEARQVASMGANTLMQLVFSAYGRQDEFQADKLGIKYMHLAGYDLNGMIKTFEILKAESKGPEVPLLLRSHPYLDDRIKKAGEEIAQTDKDR